MAAEQSTPQVDPSPEGKQKFPFLITVALALVVFFASLMLVRSRGGSTGVPLITSSNHYNEVLEEVENKTALVLEKAELEQPLTDEESAILEQAEPLVIGLINYNPDRFNIYLLAAKIAFAEQKYEAAIDACTRLYERGPARGSDAVISAVAETRYVASRSYFHMRRFDESIAEAKEAVKLRPKDPRYYWSLTSTYTEIGETQLALKTIDEASKRGIVDTRLGALADFLKPKPKETPKDKPKT